MSLDPFLGTEGIIRLKTRITERADMGDFGIPAVLSSRHPIVKRLVLSTHVKLCHVGVQGLEPLARQVLDFKRLEEHLECSVEMCHMQKT